MPRLLCCALPPPLRGMPARLQDHGRLKDKFNLGVPPVSRVELVQRTNLWGYQAGGARPFLKITCALPNLVTACRSEWRLGGGEGGAGKGGCRKGGRQPAGVSGGPEVGGGRGGGVWG